MEYDLNVREYWRILRKRKIIVLFSTLMMAAFSFTIAYLKKPVPIYEATATLKVEKNTTATGLYMEALSWSGADYLETQVSIATSYPIMEKVAKEMELINKDLDTNAVRSNRRLIDIVLDLKDRVSAAREGDTNLVNITAISTDPENAQDVANTVARVFTVEHTKEINRRTTDARKFIEQQLEIVGAKLEATEDRVRLFREEHKLVSLDSQTSALLGTLATAEAEYAKISKLVESMTDVLMRLRPQENRPISPNETFYIDKASELYKNLNAKLVSLLLEKEPLLLTYTEEYPEVQAINKQISEIARNMANQLEGELSVARKRATDLEAKIREHQEGLELLPEKRLALARLERDVKLTEKVYSLLETNLQEARIKEAGRIEEIVIVRPALEPEHPRNRAQVKLKALLGGFIGLLVGLVFAFIYETMDTSIGAIKEVEEFLGVKVLGVIPAVDLKDIKEAFKEKYEIEELSSDFYRARARLITHFLPQSTAAESYRAMRTNLQFAAFDKQLKTIAFTSAVANEGKSTTVVNVAIALAQAQNKVLLAEADFRKPVVARWFGIEPLPGLTEVILGSYPWRDTVRTIADIMLGRMDVDEVMLTPGLDNLHIIPTGQVPPNPAELVNSDSLLRFLDDAKKEYDVILVDLPPVLSAADTSVVSARVDAVTMVYRAGSTARHALRRAKDQLQQVGSNVLGIVLNDLKAEISSDYNEFDYYRYYGYDNKKSSNRGKRMAISGKKILDKLNKAKKDLKTKENRKSWTLLWRMVAIVLLAFTILGLGLLWRETLSPRHSPLHHAVIHKKVMANEAEPPTQYFIRREQAHIENEEDDPQ